MVYHHENKFCFAHIRQLLYSNIQPCRATLLTKTKSLCAVRPAASTAVSMRLLTARGKAIRLLLTHVIPSSLFKNYELCQKLTCVLRILRCSLTGVPERWDAAVAKLRFVSSSEHLAFHAFAVDLPVIATIVAPCSMPSAKFAAWLSMPPFLATRTFRLP